MKGSNVCHNGSLLFIQRVFKNDITIWIAKTMLQGFQNHAIKMEFWSPRSEFFGFSLGINGFAFKV